MPYTSTPETSAMRLVYVEWIDSSLNPGGWQDISFLKRSGCALSCLRSVGWLLIDDPDFKKLVSNMNSDGDEGDEFIGYGAITIPTVAITKLEYLTVPGEDIALDPSWSYGEASTKLSAEFGLGATVWLISDHLLTSGRVTEIRIRAIPAKDQPNPRFSEVLYLIVSDSYGIEYSRLSSEVYATRELAEMRRLSEVS